MARYKDYQRLVIDTDDDSDPTELVAAVPEREIRVVSFTLMAAGEVTVQFGSDDGSAVTPISGAYPLVDNTGLVVPGNVELAHPFETLPGEALVLSLSAGTQVVGDLVYYVDYD